MVGKKRQPPLIVRPDPGQFQQTQGVIHPLLGKDFLGRTYISTELPWVTLDETTGEAVIDVDAARADGVEVTLEGDDLVLRW